MLTMLTMQMKQTKMMMPMVAAPLARMQIARHRSSAFAPMRQAAASMVATELA